MSHLEGNSSAASSSVVASSAVNSSSVEADGSAASSVPGSIRKLKHGGNHGQREQQELFGHDPATYGRPEEVDSLGLAVCE